MLIKKKLETPLLYRYNNEADFILGTPSTLQAYLQWLIEHNFSLTINAGYEPYEIHSDNMYCTISALTTYHDENNAIIQETFKIYDGFCMVESTLTDMKKATWKIISQANYSIKL